MDGLYATSGMIAWCNKNQIPFEMCFYSNRKISLDHEKPDVTVKINDSEKLRLKGEKCCRTVKPLWKGEMVYVTSVKRFRKDGSSIIVYQISNVALSARDHALFYTHRWNIEKFFRTAKQHRGLTHCQSRKKSLQENHIYNVFVAYAILQLERKKGKLKNPEEALLSSKRKMKNTLSITFKTHLSYFWY